MREGTITVFLLLIFSVVSGQTADREALAYYNHGVYLVGKKQFAGAVVNFTEAIRRDSLFLQAYENRGVARYYLNDPVGAIADYDKALKINPDDYSTFGRRGWAKYQLQQYREAISDFNKAIEGKRDNAGYYVIRGQSKFKIQDYDGALEDFNRVVKSLNATRDNKRKALFWRAMVKIELGQKESACVDFSESMRLGYRMAGELADIYCF
ncbi:MAG: tetratricopeptide repeat protein [Bacteroidales bacterium]|nr:tetratricopeptide repeat protein [Bacteroidales bacterium]